MAAFATPSPGVRFHVLWLVCYFCGMSFAECLNHEVMLARFCLSHVS